MSKQITMLEELQGNDQMLFGIEAIPVPSKEEKDRLNRKRKWENAFQKWSDNHGIEIDSSDDYGCCGYGSMCDWCTDNSYGRPCVRALNKMCREKKIKIDYSNYDFMKVWRNGIDQDDGHAGDM